MAAAVTRSASSPCFDVATLATRLAGFPQLVGELRAMARKAGDLNASHMGSITVALFNAGRHDENEALHQAQCYRPPDKRFVEFVRALARRQARIDYAEAMK